MKLQKIFSTILFALMPLIGVADIMRDLHEARYDIYYADINSVEFGLDGYPDIYLSARDDFIPIGVGNSFMVSLPSGYQDKMFCGQPSGDFVECSIGFGALLPDEKTSSFDFLVGDFNGDGIRDGLLHSQDQNTNSIYLEHDGNGDVEIISQFTDVDGYYVSGSDISITNELGSSASEINFDGTHYSEFNGEEFGKVRGGPLVADVTGATPGTMNVSMGVMQYSIPVSLPEGPAGINPSFSINYASEAGYGHLGMGFRISGISAIERCSTDFHRDGVVKGVSGVDADRACLDGNRLVLVSGEYWEENSEYRLEAEAFARITYADDAFTVEQKNGDVYQYGLSQESRFEGGEAVGGAISRWSLEWVGDRLGYGYRITYKEGTAGRFPERISYTVGDNESASSAGLVVDFSYEADAYQLASSLFGKKYSLGRRLLNITLRSNGTKTRSWYFNYKTNDITGRSLLDEYQECGLDDVCLSPTKLDWQLGNQPSFANAVYHQFPGTPTTEYAMLEGYHAPGLNGWLDLNRDGIDDYCRMSPLNGAANTPVEVVCYINNGSGQFSSSFVVDVDLQAIRFSEHYYNWNIDPSWVDINADGFIDLCFSRPKDSHDQLVCRINNGSLSAPFQQSVTANISRPVEQDDIIGRSWIDVNGDSKIDYCYTYILPNEDKFVRCATQNQSSFSFESNVFTKKISELGGSWVDVNGDSLPDFCILEDDKIVCHINNEGENISAAVWSKAASATKSPSKNNYTYRGSTTKYFNVKYFDFTGNGYSDFCRITYKVKNGKHGYEARCLESTGKSWGEEHVSNFLPVINHSPSVPVYEELPEATKFTDVNKDGYVDWCVENSWELNYQGALLTCYLSSSEGFGNEPVTYELPHLGGTSGIRALREVNRGDADVDGDGSAEYCALYWKSHYPYQLDRGIACYGPQVEQTPDVLIGAENGFGLHYAVDYTDISDSSIYSYRTQPGEFGQISLASGKKVVSEFKVSNGLGGNHTQEYFYSDYAYDPNGYGGMGFEYVQVLSEGGNKRAETFFSQNLFDHTAGQPTESKVSYKVGSSFVVVSATENDWETVIYNDGAYSVSSAANIFDQNEQGLRFAVRLRESISEQNELDGSQVSSTTTTSIYSDYGDLEDQTIVTDGASQGFTKNIDTTFYPPDFSSWILGRQKRTTVSTWGNYQGQAASAVTRTSSWEYYPAGSLFEGMILKEVIEPDSAEFRKEKVYTYTDFGLKESVTEKRNGLPDRVTTYGYDTTGRFLETVTNSLGHTVTNHFDPITGNKTESIDANGLVSTFEYDRTGRPETSYASTGQSQQTRYKDCAMVADCPANAVWYTEQWAESALGSKMSGLVKAYKDVLGRDIEVRTETFDGSIAVVRTVYGADGEVKKVSEPFFKGASPTAWNEIVSRDELKRPTQEQNAAGLTTITEYLGLTTRKTLSWQNPIAGEGGTVTQVANSTEDVLGNLRSATDPDYRTINYQYDGANQLKVVTLPDNLALTNSYDLLGRKTASSDPNMGNWKYAYNGDDQLVLQENGSGKRTCIAYDSLGRKVAVADDYQPSASWPSALVSAKNGCSGQMATASWQFDVPGKGVGRLAWVEHANGYRNEVFYDNYGRVESTETEYDGFTVVSSKTYDSATGRVKQATLPHRSSGPSVDIEYRYNSLGHLYEVGEAGDPSQYYWRVESKTVRGQINETYRANGMIRGHYNFDANSGVLSQIRAKSIIHADWNIQDNHYVHNAKGLMRKRTDSLQQIEELFTYDALDRLDMASVVHQSDPALSYNQDPDYDISGNITQRNDVGTYHYDESCEHLGQSYTPGPYAVTEVSGVRNASYCYDSGGNMLSGDGKNITYNAFNKPTKIQSPSATVDMVYGPGRGLIKHTTTTSGKILTKHNFGGYENIEINESGQLTRKERFTLPGGVVISYEDGDPATRKEEYLFNDALGSVVAVTDGLAQVTEQYRYDPWGRPRLANWQALTDSTWENLGREEGATGKGFTGHQMLDEVGVIHMGGRIYDPTLGRFMSADPVVKGLANVESYNRYSYVLNSPMSFTDPSGYSWWSENVTDKLRDLRKKYKREILGVMTFGMSEQVRFASEEVARFAAKNKYAGEVIGVVGIAACSGFSGPAVANCAGAFQGVVTAGIASENGASFEEALKAGTRSGAIAYLNASAARLIKNSFTGDFSKGVMHGLRGGLAAKANGADFRSGFTGGFTEGLLGNRIQGIFGDSKAGGAIAAGFLSGTVSEVTGGKFVVGAATGAFGYLANQMLDNERPGISAADPEDIPHLKKMHDLALQAASEVDANFDSICTGRCVWLPWLRPMIRGTAIHSLFADKVRALGSPYDAEVSYKNGVLVPYGTKGSVRADAIYGNIVRPSFVVELKTGVFNYMSVREAGAYLENVPRGTGIYPIKVD